MAPRKQKLQPSQAYSKLYYSSKLHPVMEKEFPLYQANLKAIAAGAEIILPAYQQLLSDRSGGVDSGRLAFLNAVAREMYEAETDEVKAEVAARQASEDLADEPAYLTAAKDGLSKAEYDRYMANHTVQQ